MPYDKHIRVTAIGRIEGTDETWQWGFSMTAPGTDKLISPSDAAANAFGNLTTGEMDELAGNIAAFHARQETHLTQATVLERVKFALKGGPLNHYIDEDPYEVNLPDTPGAFQYNSDGRNYVTPQSALAVTLQSDKRGPSGRGRFFLPMPAVKLNGAMLVELPIAEELRGSCAQLLNDVNNLAGVDGQFRPEVCIASSTGENHKVTSVRLGRVVDTVRSRRKSIPESYTAPLPVS